MVNVIVVNMYHTVCCSILTCVQRIRPEVTAKKQNKTDTLPRRRRRLGMISQTVVKQASTVVN
jgi:hypothetical protein